MDGVVYTERECPCTGPRSPVPAPRRRRLRLVVDVDRYLSVAISVATHVATVHLYPGASTEVHPAPHLP